MKQARASIHFQTGDLDNKTWEQVLEEIAEDTKTQLLEDLKKKYPVPKQLIANVFLIFNSNGRNQTKNNAKGS